MGSVLKEDRRNQAWVDEQVLQWYPEVFSSQPVHDGSC